MTGIIIKSVLTALVLFFKNILIVALIFWPLFFIGKINPVIIVLGFILWIHFLDLVYTEVRKNL